MPPFPRITYTEAIKILNDKGNPIQWGDDFGGDEETLLASQFDRPVMVTRFPAAFKAFYMQPDPENPDVVLGLDLIAPEGLRRDHRRQPAHPRPRPAAVSASSQHNLPVEAFQWYLDVRKYGAFPHSGFGMGIERFVAWMTRPHAPARDHPVPADAVQDLSLGGFVGAPGSHEADPALSPGPSLAALILIWGTTWAVIRVGLRGIPPFTGVALRFALASAALLALAPFFGVKLGRSPIEWRIWWRQRLSDLLPSPTACSTGRSSGSPPAWPR